MDVLFVLEKSRTARFEPSNAIVRWTIARIRLDGFDTMIILFVEKNNATNLAGTCADDRYLKCAVTTNKKRLVLTSLFLFGEIKDGQI